MSEYFKCNNIKSTFVFCIKKIFSSLWPSLSAKTLQKNIDEKSIAIKREDFSTIFTEAIKSYQSVINIMNISVLEKLKLEPCLL